MSRIGSGGARSNRLNCSTSSEEDAEDVFKFTEDVVLLQLGRLRKKIYKKITQKISEEHNIDIGREEISQVFRCNEARVIRALTVSMSSAPSLASFVPSTYTWASRLCQQRSEHTFDDHDAVDEAVIAAREEGGESSNGNNEPRERLANAVSKVNEVMQNVEHSVESAVIVMDSVREQASDATLVNQDIQNSVADIQRDTNVEQVVQSGEHEKAVNQEELVEEVREMSVLDDVQVKESVEDPISSKDLLLVNSSPKEEAAPEETDDVAPGDQEAEAIPEELEVEAVPQESAIEAAAETPDEVAPEKPHEVAPKSQETEVVHPSNTISSETVVDSVSTLPDEIVDEEMLVFESDLEEHVQEEADTCEVTLQTWRMDPRLHSVSTIAADDVEEQAIRNLDLQNEDASGDDKQNESTPGEMLENNAMSHRILERAPESESVTEELNFISPDMSWDEYPEPQFISSAEDQVGASGTCLNVAGGDFAAIHSQRAVADQTNCPAHVEVEPFVLPTTHGSIITPNTNDNGTDEDILFAEEFVQKYSLNAALPVKLLRFNAPDDFYLVYHDYEELRATMRERITAWAIRNMEKPGVVIYKDLVDLHPGLPVLVFSSAYKQYERAIITKYVPNEDFVDVFLVDTGETVNVPLENTLQMGLEHSLYEPLVIHCTMPMSRKYDYPPEFLEDIKGALIDEADEFRAVQLVHQTEDGKLVVQLKIRTLGEGDFVDIFPSIISYLEGPENVLEGNDNDDLTGVTRSGTLEQQQTMRGQTDDAAPKNRSTSPDEW